MNNIPNTPSADWQMLGSDLIDLQAGAAWLRPLPGAHARLGLHNPEAPLQWQQPEDALLDLSDIAAGMGGFAIDGAALNDSAGNSVSLAGDVNGDGYDDLIVGAYTANGRAGLLTGTSYVVYGGPDGTHVNLADVEAGIGGFAIHGEFSRQLSGYSVAGAGDVNGDGLADVIVGTTAASAYVVFGRTDGRTVKLADIADGHGGFVISGSGAGGDPFIVQQAGDVNGDGRADLLIGMPTGSRDHDIDAGRSYVVYGKSGGTPIDLAAIEAGEGGFAIHGDQFGARSGASVHAAGDVNGDGLADLVIGAPYASSPVDAYAGRAYVVFGKTSRKPVELSSVAHGKGGFVIEGAGAFDQAGTSVSGAGDVNGDGLADLIVGTAGNGAYVVFGKLDTAAVQLADLAATGAGFAITGPNAPGSSVAMAGDMNGDGLADLLVQATQGSGGGGVLSGRSYVVFGRSGSTPVSLADVARGDGGFAIDGESAGDYSGGSMSAAGDLNGDGLADLLIGAMGHGTSGRAYVIYGSTDGVFAGSAVDAVGGATDDALVSTSAAQTIAGGAGDDTLTGNGGADVLLGGAGDDVFVLNASNLQALMADFGSSGQEAQYARVDGGSGYDTLRVTGVGQVLDLREVASNGASTLGSTSRLESIEVIDLTGTGPNGLRGRAADVWDIGEQNWLNSSTQDRYGFSAGTYQFAESERAHQLIIEGNSGDVVEAGDTGWIRAGSVRKGSNVYVVFNSEHGRAQVIIDSDVRTVGFEAPDADHAAAAHTAALHGSVYHTGGPGLHGWHAPHSTHGADMLMA